MRVLFAILLLASMLESSQALAHSRLKPSADIKPRSTDPGIKTGPCGGFPRSASPIVLTAGQVINVTWEETIHHPGRYEFYFAAAGDKNFVLLKTVQNRSTTNESNQFSTKITLPNQACAACTFQLIQVMTENPDNPTSYYSCADMKLNATPAPQPGPNPVQPSPSMPAPAPMPAPVDCDPGQKV